MSGPLTIPRAATACHPLLLAWALLTLIAACSSPERAIPATASSDSVYVNRLTDASLPDDKFGVFIGINDYPGLAPGRQLTGAVNDALGMRDFFAVRSGFLRHAVLTNSAATRAAIGRVLIDLTDEVERAAIARRASRNASPISVVITFAGHGSQVADQESGAEGNDEADGFDETIVPFDALALDGSLDIRDDDLSRVNASLARAGAQVLILADSCHSGTIERVPSVAKTRLGRSQAETGGHRLVIKGSEQSLFPTLEAAKRPRPDGNEAVQLYDEVQAMPGFVAISACASNQKAYEDVDAAGQAHGRLTWAMLRVLTLVDPLRTTNAGLFRLVQAEFCQRWPVTNQTPQLAVSSAKKGERFLNGGYPALRPTIVPGSQDGRRLSVTFGTVHGAAVGSEFVFFRTALDMEMGAVEIARGVVVDAQPFSSIVELSEPSQPAPDAVAQLRCLAAPSFTIVVTDSIPEVVRHALEELRDSGAIGIASPNERFDIALVYDSLRRVVSLYGPEAASSEGRPSDNSLPPLREVPLASDGRASLESQAGQVAANVLYLARIQRLVSLRVREREIEATILPRKRDANGRVQPIEVTQEEDSCSLEDGSMFAIRVRNNSRHALFVTAFLVNDQGGVEIIDPPPDESAASKVAPEAELVLGETRLFFAKLVSQEELKRTGCNRVRIKIIATRDEIDFWPLARDPAINPARPPGVRGPRGVDTALYRAIAGPERYASDHPAVYADTLLCATCALEVSVRPSRAVAEGGAVNLAESDRASAITREPIAEPRRFIHTGRFALVVGVSKYSNGYAPLTRPAFDASGLAKTLAQRFGYSVTLMLSEPPPTELFPSTTQRMSFAGGGSIEIAVTVLDPPVVRAQVAKLGELVKRGPGTESLLFYFAGHGARTVEGTTAQGFAALEGAVPGKVVGHLPLRQIAEDLVSCRAHHTLAVLDCCYSGSFLAGEGANSDLGRLWTNMHTEERQSPVSDILVRTFERPAFQVLAAGSSAESVADQSAVSAAYARAAPLRASYLSKHSPFTALVLEALEGRVGLQDGTTRASDLGYHLVRMLAGSKELLALGQTPIARTVFGEGDMPFVPAIAVLSPEFVAPLYQSDASHSAFRAAACRALLLSIGPHSSLASQALFHVGHLLYDDDYDVRAAATQVFSEVAKCHPGARDEFLPHLARLTELLKLPSARGRSLDIVRSSAASTLAHLAFAAESAEGAMRQYLADAEQAWQSVSVGHLLSDDMARLACLAAHDGEGFAATDDPNARVSGIYKRILAYEGLLGMGENEIAVHDRKLLQRQSYVSVLARGLAALGQGRTEDLRAFLSSTDQGLRGWEWYYLASGARSGVLQLSELGAVTAFAFQSDGVRLAVAQRGMDNKEYPVQVWDALLGVPVHSLRGHRRAVTCMQYLSGTSLLVSGSLDRTIRTWDTKSGEAIDMMEVGNDVRAITVDATHGRIACGSSDGSVRIVDIEPNGKLERSGKRAETGWSIRAGKLSAFVRGSMNSTVEVRETVNGSTTVVSTRVCQAALRSGALDEARGRIAVGLDNGKIEIWDVRAPDNVLVLPGHRDAVVSIGFAPGADLVASAGWDDVLKLWDAKTGRELATLSDLGMPFRAGAQQVGFRGTGDLQTVLLRCEDGSLNTWFTTNHQHAGATALPIAGVHCLRFDNSGQVLAIGASSINGKKLEGKLGFCNVESLTMRTTWTFDKPVRGVSFCAVASQSCTVETDCVVIKANPTGAGVVAVQLQRNPELPEPYGSGSVVVNLMAVSGDDVRIASVDKDATVADIFDLGTTLGRTKVEIKGQASALALSPDGASLVVGRSEGAMELLATEAQRQPFAGIVEKERHIASCAFSFDGRSALLCTVDGVTAVDGRKTIGPLSGQVILRNTSHGETSKVTVFENNWGHSAVFNWEGTQVAVGSRNKPMKLFTKPVFIPDGEPRPANAKRMTITELDTGRVQEKWFIDPDEEGRTGVIRIIDVEGKRVLYELAGHADTVEALGFARNGDRLASGSVDGSVLLWDLNKREQIAAIRAHDEAVTALTVTQDCKWIATGSSDGAIKVWDWSGNYKATIGIAEPVSVMSALGLGSKIVVGTERGRIAIISVEPAFCVRMLDSKSKSKVRSLSVSADYSRIASVSDDGVLRLWDGVGLDPLCSLPSEVGHESRVSASFSMRDEALDIITRTGGLARLWARRSLR